MIDWDELERRNAGLNAFIDWDRSAKAGAGPLAGVTIGVKSNIAVAGLPWTAGMALRRDVAAERDAAVVARLRAAGAAILGTLNMHEAALGSTTDNPWFGATHNPHRHGHTPGGSSGGSGAAVAAGLCDAALGTDTLGSVRIPAAYTGVYGLKPTNGAVDDEGLHALDRGFDCIGPLARDLDVLELVWATMCSREGGSPDGDGTGLPPSREHGFAAAVVLTDLAGVAVQPAVAAAYDRTLAALDLPRSGLALPASPTAIRRAALARIGRTLAADLGADRTERAALISPELHFVLGAAEGIAPDPALLAATRDALVGAIGDDGVLIMPTAPQTAFARGSRAPAGQADFTGLANIAGLPALAIPAGSDADGLPVGVQLVGPAGSEARLIVLARALADSLGGAVLPDYGSS